MLDHAIKQLDRLGHSRAFVQCGGEGDLAKGRRGVAGDSEVDVGAVALKRASGSAARARGAFNAFGQPCVAGESGNEEGPETRMMH